MLTATVIGFDGASRVYTSTDDADQRMDQVFEQLAAGAGYEVTVEADAGGTFGADLYQDWTFGDEARERGALRADRAVTYRLVPE